MPCKASRVPSSVWLSMDHPPAPELRVACNASRVDGTDLLRPRTRTPVDPCHEPEEALRVSVRKHSSRRSRGFVACGE